MFMHTRKQALKRILQEYVDEELKYYDKYDNLPPHNFSEEYRRKMDELVKQPMKKQSFISKVFKRKSK